MKAKTKTVYYCDYCKKHSLRPLAKHEQYCTGNPNRQCGLCGRTETLSGIIALFKKQTGYIEKQGEYEIELQNICQPHIKDIMEELENCPICTFAVIRQVGLHKYPFDMEGFKLENELKLWWDAVNAEQTKHDMY